MHIRLVIPASLITGRFLNGLGVGEWGFGMPKHVCGVYQWPFGKRCTATAIKTKRGAWRCPLHGGLSTGPKSPEGKARIAAAARRRWEAYRAAKAAHLIRAKTIPTK